MPVLYTKENELVDSIGLDATVFLRVTRMCRDIFLVMSVIGLAVMIPVNTVLSRSNYSNSTGGKSSSASKAFTTMTPLYVSSKAIWSQVICAWAFDIIVGFFLWWNYRAIVGLRRRYFKSPEYQRTLHARTLMVWSNVFLFFPFSY